MKKSFYTSGEAAKRCGLALSTLKRWIRKGALKSHRTPGGDLRIRHDHLIDFMREFDIPLQDLLAESRPVVLVCVEEEPWRKDLLAELALLEVKVLVRKNDLELGFGLALEKPQFMVLQSRSAEEDLQRCQHVRKILSPNVVRIGMVGTGPASLALARPEVSMNPAGDPSWPVLFLSNLLGRETATAVALDCVGEVAG